MDFLNASPWAPNGFVSEEDALAQAHALINPRLNTSAYAYGHHDIGDEAYDPNTWGFIPTQTQVGAALAAIQMAQLNGHEAPGTDQPPTLQQLTSSMYANAAALWAELAASNAAGSGW